MNNDKLEAAIELSKEVKDLAWEIEVSHASQVCSKYPSEQTDERHRNLVSLRLKLTHLLALLQSDAGRDDSQPIDFKGAHEIAQNAALPDTLLKDNNNLTARTNPSPNQGSVARSDGEWIVDSKEGLAAVRKRVHEVFDITDEYTSLGFHISLKDDNGDPDNEIDIDDVAIEIIAAYLPYHKPQTTKRSLKPMRDELKLDNRGLVKVGNYIATNGIDITNKTVIGILETYLPYHRPLATQSSDAELIEQLKQFIEQDFASCERHEKEYPNEEPGYPDWCGNADDYARDRELHFQWERRKAYREILSKAAIQDAALKQGEK